MLRYGEMDKAYYMVLISVSDEEVAEWKKGLKNAFTVISMDKLKLVPLQLEKNSEIGSIEKNFYDPAANGWTSPVDLIPFE